MAIFIVQRVYSCKAFAQFVYNLSVIFGLQATKKKQILNTDENFLILPLKAGYKMILH